MEFESFGTERIYRPSLASEQEMRNAAEAALRVKYEPGAYRNRDEINGVLQHYFAFYDSRLKTLIPELASRHYMEFVLANYDVASRIEENRKSKLLTPEESERWRKLGPTFRRATKYVAECVCMLAPSEAPQAAQADIERLTDLCWICAEQMVQLSILSTQTFALFPDDTILELKPPGESLLIDLSLTEEDKYEGFVDRIQQDVRTRKAYVDDAEFVFSNRRIADHLDQPMEMCCGFKMTTAISFAANMNSNAIQPGRGFDVPFVSESLIMSALTEDIGVQPEAAIRLINGLSLRKSNMTKEGRVLWKPKQEHRALARPLFEFPHPIGPHYTWSREMAKECLLFLMGRLSQKQLPSEWLRGDMHRALESYVASITEEFEQVVNESLRGYGIIAKRFKSCIGRNECRLEIPQDIGELDTLAYWPAQNLLVIGEDKFVKPTLEPATFRDDLDKFLNKDKNYVEQLKRKFEWTIKNASSIASSLSSEVDFPSTVEVKCVAPALITFYPSFASYFIRDVPCVALTELMSEIKSNGAWPYKPVMPV